MRLIDCHKAKRAIYQHKTQRLQKETVLKILDSAPTIDAVPVVRCKDCKYIIFSDCYGECGKGYLGMVQPNDFCSRGERKEAK